jgi:hypothetical protein
MVEREEALTALAADREAVREVVLSRAFLEAVGDDFGGVFFAGIARIPHLGSRAGTRGCFVEWLRAA